MDVEQNWYEEKPVSEAKITELDLLCREYADYRKEKDALKDQMSALEEKLAEREKRIVAHLTEHGKSSWAAAGQLFVVAHRSSVQTPKDPAEKEAFFNYLKQRGQFEDMVSVNYNTLNAWYNSEKEASEARGELSFSVPGLQLPVTSQILQMRKGK